MDKDSNSYEYEESVVLVELNGIIDSNHLLQEQTPIKILGIDTEKPILKFGHYIFAGEFEDIVGTVLAYEPTNTENKEGDGCKFVCKADKKLSMKRIFVQEQEASKIGDMKDGKTEFKRDMLQDLTKRNVKENIVDDSVMDCSNSLSKEDK